MSMTPDMMPSWELKAALDAAEVEITRLRVELDHLTPKRFCLMCGREEPANKVAFRGEPEDCPEQELDGQKFRLCMFDMTEAEALDYWRKKYHDEITRLRASLDKAREALRPLAERAAFILQNVRLADDDDPYTVDFKHLRRAATTLKEIIDER